METLEDLQEREEERKIERMRRIEECEQRHLDPQGRRNQYISNVCE